MNSPLLIVQNTIAASLVWTDFLKAFCERLGLENVNKTSLSKSVSKMLVEKAMRREDEKQLRESMEGRTKVQDLVSENLLLKDYFKEKSLTATREMFRIRTNMNELRGNFKNDKKFLSTGVLCVACGLMEEVNSHVMDCPFYTVCHTYGYSTYRKLPWFLRL